MSSHLDSIPQAVATIVSACYGSLLHAAGKSTTYQDENEKRIINFAGELARALAKAIQDSDAGRI